MNTEEKAKAYDEALEGIQEILNSGQESIKMSRLQLRLQGIFPELKYNEDERTRKAILTGLIDCRDAPDLGWSNFGGINIDECIAWLEKQGDSDKSLYIRFGDIPTDGKSKVYNGEIETGIEEGISVYPAFEDKEGNIILGLNLPISKTSLHTQQHLLEYDNRPCYLVSGDYLGKGTDGEPLIKNVRIVKEIKPYRIKQDKENNTYVINNTPNCGISVYNEELKDSEDERIRKELIELIGCMHDADPRKKVWITWLEKQGEQETDEWKEGNIIRHGGILAIVIKGRRAMKTNGEIFTVQYPDEWVKAAPKEIEYFLNEFEKQSEQKPADKAEPKFKVGDWITNSIETVQFTGYDIDYGYQVDYEGNLLHRDTDIIEKEYRLWNINDAKDGDVLVDEDNNIGIYKGKDDIDWDSYTYLGCDGKLRGFSIGGRHKQTDTHPATKEQRVALEKAMADAEYTLDFEKKELKKIENEIEECKIEHIEHGKYYYCIKDYFCGGKKQASKGDVVQALRGMSIMALGAKANEYFLPVNFIKYISAWSEEDEANFNEALSYIKDDTLKEFIKSIKQRIGG